MLTTLTQYRGRAHLRVLMFKIIFQTNQRYKIIMMLIRMHVVLNGFVSI